MNTKKQKKTGKEDAVLELMLSIPYIQGENSLYAIIEYGERKKRVSTEGVDFKDYITSKYYEKFNEYIEERDIRDRLKIIRYYYRKAYSDEMIFPKRYGFLDGNIYIDIANDSLEYFVVNKEGFELVAPEDEKSFFVSNNFELPMASPKQSKSTEYLACLDSFLNLEDEEKFLFKIYLVACMNPSIRTPMGYFLGKAGTGKTSMMRILEDIIDPSKRGEINWDGTSVRDVTVAMNHSSLLAFDNVSKITTEHSDLLCRSVTGGSFSARKKYSDNDEILYDIQTHIIVSGINNAIKQNDLGQRTLFFNTISLDNKERIAENDFPELLDKCKSEILYDALKLLSIGLSAQDIVKKKRKIQGRLASFEIFGRAIAIAMDNKNGEERFIRIMEKQKLQQQIWASDNDRCYFESLLEVVKLERYDGKLKGLYELVNTWIMDMEECPYDENIIPLYDRFCKMIHRYEENLCSLGYKIDFYSTKLDNYSAISIEALAN